jgi:hypothetical protein
MKEKDKYKCNLDKYKCKIHGNIGHQECSECWEALEKMCRDRKAFLIYDKRDKLLGEIK